MATEKEFLIELDGPGVSPETVDTVQLLQLAEMAFRLVLKVSEGARATFTLRGLHVRDKCVAVAAVPSDMSAAQIGAARMIGLVDGREPPTHGIDGLVRDIREQLRKLPAGQAAKCLAGEWSHKLEAPPLPPERPWERTELRATVVRVGGIKPRAWFTSDSERDVFNVAADVEDAVALGQHLYTEVDVTLDVVRNADGAIEDGKVVEVVPLAEGDSAEVWRSWFAKNASQWEQIDDVMVELGRVGD
jgi:hypothetical protein